MTGVNVAELKILIVDDNVHFRMLVHSILSALGVSAVEEAHDGSEALELLDDLSPDLVIIDWKMEGMDGVECVRKIRALQSDNRFVPIIMMTGYTGSKLKNKARDVGANGFLGKPISPQSLLGRITDVMESPRPVVDAKDYFGPDRRKVTAEHDGPERRVSSSSLIVPPKS